MKSVVLVSLLLGACLLLAVEAGNKFSKGHHHYEQVDQQEEPPVSLSAVQQIKNNIDECFARNENPFLCLTTDDLGYLLLHDNVLDFSKTPTPTVHLEGKERELSGEIRSLNLQPRGATVHPKKLKNSAILRRIASMIASVILYNPSAASEVYVSWKAAKTEAAIRERIIDAVRANQEHLGMLTDNVKIFVGLYAETGFDHARVRDLFRGNHNKLESLIVSGYRRVGVAALGPEGKLGTGVAVAVVDKTVKL